MKAIIIGPQHSCTRLFTAIIDRHPDIEYAEHWSVPSGTQDNYQFPIYKNPNTEEPETYDKILVVNRDSNAIDLSCLRDNIEIFLDDESKNQSYKTKSFIIDSINNLSESDREKLTIASFENLVTYKEVYLRQLFTTMGLDPNTYDYNLTGRYTFDPPRWFTVNLDLVDTNRKYLKL
jgi:hypothetical protein